MIRVLVISLLLAASVLAQPRPVIGIGGIVHETNTFNPKKTTLADFETGIGGAKGTLRGQEILTLSANANNTTAGFMGASMAIVSGSAAAKGWQ